MKLLFSIAKNGKAVLMATHDYELMAKFPGRKLSFEKGTIDPGIAKGEISNEKNASESID